MLKKMFKLLAISGLIIGLNHAALAGQDTVNPNGYDVLKPAQPTQHPEKIEVIEFFWYGCPHCYSFEPGLEAWVKKQSKNVEFVRIPAMFAPQWVKHAKAYYTAEALGVVDKIHADFFDAVQIKKESLESEEELAKFFVAHDVDEQAFHDAYNSFSVDTKMRLAPVKAAMYNITGVPAVIINGKYKTNGSIAGSHEKMLEAMDKLVQEESTHLK